MADTLKTADDLMKMMKDKDVKFLDLRFTDTKGKTNCSTPSILNPSFPRSTYSVASTAAWS